MARNNVTLRIDMGRSGWAHEDPSVPRQLSDFIRVHGLDDRESILSLNEFINRKGVLAQNRFYRQVEGRDLLAQIEQQGNRVAIPAAVDERGYAYADTVWILLKKCTPRTITIISELGADEAHNYASGGIPVIRIWWD